MEGLAPFLRRAREHNLIETPKVPPPPPTQKAENDENQVPTNVVEALGNMKLSEPSQLKSGLKPLSRIPRAPRELEPVSSPEKRAQGTREPEDVSLSESRVLTSQASPEHTHGALATRRAPAPPPPPPLPSQTNASPKSVTVEEPSRLESGEPVQPDLEIASPVQQYKELSACEIIQDAFVGLPGMEAYRDIAADSDEEEDRSSLPIEEEEDGDEDSDEDTLLCFAGLIATTKKLSLRDGSRRNSDNHNEKSKNSSSHNRKKRDEVREKFIGQKHAHDKPHINNRYLSVGRVDVTRQSVSEMSEISDVSCRQSEIILSNFPLLPFLPSASEEEEREEDGNERNVFVVKKTIREEEKEQKEKAKKEKAEDAEEEEEGDIFFDGFSLFSSDEEEEQRRKEKGEKIAPTPPNTPYIYEENKMKKTTASSPSLPPCPPFPSSAFSSSSLPTLSSSCSAAATTAPLMRRSSVTYTPTLKKRELPPVPLFRRNSVTYTPTHTTAVAATQGAAEDEGEAREQKAPFFRRSSVTYTPDKKTNSTDSSVDYFERVEEEEEKNTYFRRSSVAYTPNEKERTRSLSPFASFPSSHTASSQGPQTPPKTQEVKSKPPKTEAPPKTKSRIEMASPLLGVCHEVSSAQSTVRLGSLSVPAKSKIKSRFLTRRLIAVADTNVLLRDLDLVENTQNYPNVTLVIPSVVVRELDGLKNGNSNTAKDARAALHSLRKLIKGVESRSTIKFQNIDEVPKSRSYRGRARTNDDRILDCCLYYAEMTDAEEGQKVVLLTNDVALQIKTESVAQNRDSRLVSAMGMRAFYEKEVWYLA